MTAFSGTRKAQMPPKPALRPQGPIGTALAAVARDIFSEARAALSDRRRSDAERIHDFRKALKRWRALLRLLEPPLGDSARTLRKSARELARSLTRTRDAQSALAAIDDLEKEAHALSKRTLVTLRQRLQAIRRRRERATHDPVLRQRLRLRLNTAERAPQSCMSCANAWSSIATRWSSWNRSGRVSENCGSRRRSDCAAGSARIRILQFWPGLRRRTGRSPVGAHGSLRRSPSARPITPRLPRASPGGCLPSGPKRSASGFRHCGRAVIAEPAQGPGPAEGT